uniref:Immunoglobulin V-set domain-containing protein n=1 Tax=Loxodonta africana TaxID=9785 RepID=G3U5C3_LOXAF
MRFPALLLRLLILWIPASNGLTVMTQTPLSFPVILGELVTNSCKKWIYTYLHWYQHNSGWPSRLLMSMASNQFSGVPDWFSGTGLGTEFRLKISRVEDEDIAFYYCQPSTQIPAT